MRRRVRLWLVTLAFARLTDADAHIALNGSGNAGGQCVARGAGGTRRYVCGCNSRRPRRGHWQLPARGRGVCPRVLRVCGSVEPAALGMVTVCGTTRAPPMLTQSPTNSINHPSR